MGLPFSLLTSALFFAVPDAHLVNFLGYEVYNGTWKWGYHPEGEPVVGLPQRDRILLMTPAQFIDYISAPTTTTTTILPVPTPTDYSEEAAKRELEEYERYYEEFFSRPSKRVRPNPS